MNLGAMAATPKKDNGDDKPLIMTISGDLGSGKSLLANFLVEHWKADRYSTGMVQRKIAEKMGITTLELNKRAETDKTIDDQIDAVFKNLKKTAKNLVVDSRMAYHFLPESFKIKLEVHPMVAAERIKGDTSRIGEGKYTSLDEIVAAIKARKSSERERFKRYYDADIEDPAGYDIVINTTEASPEAVAEIANSSIALWRKKAYFPKFWVSPTLLYCDVDPDGIDPLMIEKCKSNWPAVGAQSDAHVQVRRYPDHGYHVENGAVWVAAALRSGKKIMGVDVIGQTDQIRDADMIDKWEKYYNYKSLY